jgi:hypothetical protein
LSSVEPFLHALLQASSQPSAEHTADEAETRADARAIEAAAAIRARKTHDVRIPLVLDLVLSVRSVESVGPSVYERPRRDGAIRTRWNGHA